MSELDNAAGPDDTSRRTGLHRGSAALATVLGVLAWSSAAVAATITTFKIPHSEDTYPLAINSSGDVTGYYLDITGGRGFIRASNGAVTTFAAFDSFTDPTGINRRGATTGAYGNGAIHGFVRGPGGKTTSFDPDGSVQTDPTGINSSGSIAGWYYDGSSVHGFLRTNDTITSFDAGSGVDTFAYCINDSDTIGGTAGGAFIRYADGTITTFNPVGSVYTNVFAINDSGAVAGAWSDGQTNHGFVRTPDGTITEFDPPGSTYTYPTAINRKGAITGLYYHNSMYSGFLRHPDGTFTRFDATSKSTDTEPYAINDDGVIAGSFGSMRCHTERVCQGFVRTP